MNLHYPNVKGLPSPSPENYVSWYWITSRTLPCPHLAGHPIVSHPVCEFPPSKEAGSLGKPFAACLEGLLLSSHPPPFTKACFCILLLPTPVQQHTLTLCWWDALTPAAFIVCLVRVRRTWRLSKVWQENLDFPCTEYCFFIQASCQKNISNIIISPNLQHISQAHLQNTFKHLQNFREQTKYLWICLHNDWVIRKGKRDIKQGTPRTRKQPGCYYSDCLISIFNGWRQKHHPKQRVNQSRNSVIAELCFFAESEKSHGNKLWSLWNLGSLSAAILLLRLPL